MIEVLVTITIVSFALLGLAAMLIKSIQHSNGSLLQGVAVQQAYDLADRMRANASGLNSGSYDNVICPAAQSCTGFTTCSTSQLAAYDVCTWNSQNGTLLPAGQGTLARGGGATYAITVNWNDRSSGGRKSVSVNVDP